MGLTSLVVFLLIGGLAGWLAGLIMRGGGFGVIGNTAVGIVGAFLAGYFLPRLGISIGTGVIGAVVHATIGSIVLLFFTGLIRR